MTEAVQPEPGDFSVCLHCAQLIRFGGKMELCRASQKEINEVFAADPAFAADVRRHQRVVRSLDRRDSEATNG